MLCSSPLLSPVMPVLDPGVRGPTVRAEEKLTCGFKPYKIHSSLSALRFSSRPSDRRGREPGTMVRPGAEPLHGPRIALAHARLSGVTVGVGRERGVKDRRRGV